MQSNNSYINAYFMTFYGFKTYLPKDATRADIQKQGFSLLAAGATHAAMVCFDVANLLKGDV